MLVIYHTRYAEVYSSDPASAPGRIESILDELKASYEFSEPEQVNEQELILIHALDHIERVKAHRLTFEIALLAAGGATRAAELAIQGDPAFALIRPPGAPRQPQLQLGLLLLQQRSLSCRETTD